MIKLSVEPYCENCTEFTPHTERVTKRDASGKTICDTDIYCGHALLCKYIASNIRKELEDENPV